MEEVPEEAPRYCCVKQPEIGLSCRGLFYAFGQVLLRESPISYASRHWNPNDENGGRCQSLSMTTCASRCRWFVGTNLFVLICVFFVWNGFSLGFIMDNQFLPNFVHSQFRPLAFLLGLLGFFLYLLSQYIWWIESYLNDNRTIFGGFIRRLEPTHLKKPTTAGTPTKPQSPSVKKQTEIKKVQGQSTSGRIWGQILFTCVSVLAYIMYKLSSMILFVFSSSFFGSFLTLYMAFIYSSDTFLGHLYQLEDQSTADSIVPNTVLKETLVSENAVVTGSSSFLLVSDQFYNDTQIRNAISCSQHNISKGSGNIFRKFFVILILSVICGTFYALLEAIYTFKLPKRSLNVFAEDTPVSNSSTFILILIILSMGFAIVLIKLAFLTVDSHTRKARRKILTNLNYPENDVLITIAENWLDDTIASSHHLYRKYFGILGYSLFMCAYRVTIDLFIASVPNIAYFRFYMAQIPSNATSIPIYDHDLSMNSTFGVKWLVMAVSSIMLLYAFKVGNNMLFQSRRSIQTSDQTMFRLLEAGGDTIRSSVEKGEIHQHVVNMSHI